MRIAVQTFHKVIFSAALAGMLCGFNLPAAADDLSSGRQTLMLDGVQRSYLIRIPRPVAQHNARVPLVLMLHGGGGNGENAEKMSGLTPKAEREGFIVVYPEGSGHLRGKLLTWNAGHCCGYAMNNRVDDVGFISALIDTLIANAPVDPKRIYVTGMSNGAMMAHRVGIELSAKVAAIAPVVGAVFGDEARPRYPVSALMLNGALDKHVPEQGGLPGGRFTGAWDGTPMKPVLAQGTFWASADGCAITPEQQDRSAFTITQYRCPNGSAVEIYLVKDNGHAWPGGRPGSMMGDTPSSAISGTDVIWEFFKAHTK